MSLSLSLHKVYDLNFSVPLWPLWYYVKNHSYKLKLLSKRYSNGFINLTTSIEEFSGELCFYSRQSPSSDFWILSWLELEVIWVILHGVSPVILRFSVKYPLWVCLYSFYYCWFPGTFVVRSSSVFGLVVVLLCWGHHRHLISVLPLFHSFHLFSVLFGWSNILRNKLLVFSFLIAELLFCLS